MKYTDEQIRGHIEDWISITGQRECRYLIHYCLGFYGYLTKQIMRVIDQMEHEGLLTWEGCLWKTGGKVE